MISYDLNVFFAGPAPTTRQWQDAIGQAGFKTVLQADVEMGAHSGFWPGGQAGFEFYLDAGKDIATAFPGIAAKIPGVDKVAMFVLHSDMREMVSVLESAAALTILTGGAYVDPQTATEHTASDVMNALRQVIETGVRELK